MNNKYPYLGTFSTLDELLEAVAIVPSDFDGLSVQCSLCHFQSPKTTLSLEEGEKLDVKKLVEQTKEIILEALKEEDKWGKVIDFTLHSYYGGMDKKDSLYITLCSKESKKFADDMFNGKYGRLD